MKWRISLPRMALLMAALYGQAAQADTVCNGSTGNLNLGTYVSFQSGPADTSGFITVTCSRTGGPRRTDVTIGLGPSFVSGSIVNRQMQLGTGSDRLGYNLYREASRTAVWGNTQGVDTVTQTADLRNNTSATLTFNVFARIHELQDVRAGDYRDTVTVTITF